MKGTRNALFIYDELCKQGFSNLFEGADEVVIQRSYASRGWLSQGAWRWELLLKSDTEQHIYLKNKIGSSYRFDELRKYGVHCYLDDFYRSAFEKCVVIETKTWS